MERTSQRCAREGCPGVFWLTPHAGPPRKYCQSGCQRYSKKLVALYKELDQIETDLLAGCLTNDPQSVLLQIEAVERILQTVSEYALLLQQVKPDLREAAAILNRTR